MLSLSSFTINRERMIQEQLLGRGIEDARVLDAMQHTPRHIFVEDALQEQAYGDFPLPIGCGQTISQPYIVALMTEALELQGHEKVLEIGTGSGYQAVVLSQLCARVYTVERVELLMNRAAASLTVCVATISAPAWMTAPWAGRLKPSLTASL